MTANYLHKGCGGKDLDKSYLNYLNGTIIIQITLTVITILTSYTSILLFFYKHKEIQTVQVSINVINIFYPPPPPISHCCFFHAISISSTEFSRNKFIANIIIICLIKMQISSEWLMQRRIFTTTPPSQSQVMVHPTFFCRLCNYNVLSIY